MNTDDEMKLVKEINDVIQKQEINSRHSYFQLKYFLIGKEPTLQSKMWQCLRELKTRNESITNMDLELEEFLMEELFDEFEEEKVYAAS